MGDNFLTLGVYPSDTAAASHPFGRGFRRPGHRLSVPETGDLLPACAAHCEQRHPAPRFEAAFQLADPADARAAGPGLRYSWCREVEPMFGKLLSDRATVPELDRFLNGLDLLQDHLADGLTESPPAKRRDQSPRPAAVGRDFPIWQRRSGEGLQDDEAADVMGSAVPCA